MHDLLHLDIAKARSAARAAAREGKPRRASERRLLDQFGRVIDERIQPLADEIARLRSRVQRPDLQKYTVDEACERLKRSRSGVYDLMKRGEITPIHEAGRTYITEEEIQRWERVQRN